MAAELARWGEIALLEELRIDLPAACAASNEMWRT
jgi:hypothetical protein